MDRREARIFAREKLAAGARKQEVFDALCQQGVREQSAALAVATYPAPGKVAKNRIHIFILIAIIWIQAVIGFLSVLGMNGDNAPLLGVILAAGLFAALVEAALTYGFVKNLAGTYNAFIILCILSVSRQIPDLSSDPGSALIGMAIIILVAFYAAFIRMKLFPDFAFLSLRKVGGRYVFTEE